MIIVCEKCSETIACIDEVSNKTETCSTCSDSAFCTIRYTDENQVDGLCRQCQKGNFYA